MVLIEALACGTPVVAYNRGSIPEIVKDGETGIIAHDLEAGRCRNFGHPEDKPGACRRHFERRFTAPRMSRDYRIVYRKLTQFHAEPPVLTAQAG